MELKGKKVIIIGERDGVQGPAIADCMKSAGAELCVFNCPACYTTIGEMVAENGIQPIFMSDLCRLAIGEKPAGWR